MNILHKSNLIDFYSADTSSNIELPLVENSISAGFPSPANDFLNEAIDLNKILIKNPATTFYGRVKGDSMQELGIDDGDLLVIDKSVEPRDGKLAVCFIDGEFTLKKIKIEENYCLLVPANPKYQPIKVTEDNDFLVWGVVKHVIKSF